MTEQAPEVVIKQKPKVRLKFIDMARSFAILLMLEGHFIEHTFKDFKPMIALVKANGTSGNVLFDWWYFMKGFTAPMFFTVTGLIFVYLLARNKEAGFWKIPRVKKGFKRCLELLFWGYMLQLNMKNVSNYFKGEFGDWVYAFHVLQSIGIGIACLLLLFGLYKLIKVVPLYVYYLVAGTAIFFIYPYLKQLPEGVFVPENTHQFFQNVIRGPHSVFAVVPWMAFTLYGGMIGALLIRFEKHVLKKRFAFIFVFGGLLLTVYSRTMCIFIDRVIEAIGLGDPDFVQNSWLYGRLGQVVLALGILMFIDLIFMQRSKKQSNLFLKVGQNTLPIYVIHVMILYGGFFGYGLKTFMTHTLNGWQTVLGAAIFLASFIVFIKYLEFFTKIWKGFLGLFTFWKWGKKAPEEA